ncbi:MAG TPA: hypothetical protein VJN43_14315 [Bryobacteraceae bacterium]|nr:hypothetical protein [Bryobacteraceae bacterium]
MSRHPSENLLALYAGGELGRFDAWRVGRHVAGCAECERDVTEFSALRSEVASATDTPAVNWGRLAVEMKANIRLGLEAGACVEKPEPVRIAFSPRALAACASLLLLVAAFLLERPTPRATEVKTPGTAVLEATGMGIQVKEGEQTLMLLNHGARDIHYSATGDAMRARYVDPDTGYVTINNVYVQ